jgi:hypothetical protein
MDGGQRGERQPLDATAELEERVDQRAHLVGALSREQGDVGAGAEHLAVASHEQGTDLASGLDLADRVEQVADQIRADQVQRWVVEREHADCPVLRELDRLSLLMRPAALSRRHRTTGTICPCRRVVSSERPFFLVLAGADVSWAHHASGRVVQLGELCSGGGD